MKANELRIGNIVLAPQYRNEGKHITEVKTISKEYADYDNKWQPAMVINFTLPETGARDIILIDGDCEPIPLTEEWLIKFGFREFSFGRYDILCNNYTLSIYPDESYSVSIRVLLEQEVLIQKTKHIHQLQNLYFALTNEELTIK